METTEEAPVNFEDLIIRLEEIEEKSNRLEEEQVGILHELHEDVKNVQKLLSALERL